jgi:heterotetrameric sarcosine oxidase gamma subunit
MILEGCSALDAPFGAPIEVPGFPTSGLRLIERSDIGCVLVNSACDLAEISAQLDVAAGFRLPRECGRAVHAPPYRALWLTPRSWLVQCPVEDEARLAAKINGAFADKRVHAALFTDYLGWFELSGGQAPALLSEGGFVSLESHGLGLGHAKRTQLAGIAVVMLRVHADAWLLAVERSRARYFAAWLSSVASRMDREDEPCRDQRVAATQRASVAEVATTI